MAIQGFVDYSRAPLLDSPAKTIFEDVLSGYKMSQEPRKMKQEATERELANALQAKALEHYEEKFKLEQDYKQAQIDKEKRGGAGLSPTGELRNYLYTHPEATPEELRKAYEEIHESKMEHEKAVTARSKDITSGKQFDNLPVNDKKQSIALMKGMGVDPVAAVSYLRKTGNDPTTYAKEHEIDITRVKPDYALGEQNIKIIQQASAYMEEIALLDTHIKEGLGDYQNKIMGYSMKQMAEAAAGENPDKQGRILAARALVPELSALRLKIMGGNIGIEALNELKNASLNTLNIVESLITPEAYRAAQEYMNEWIEEAGRTRINALTKFSMLKPFDLKSVQEDSKPKRVYDLATGKWEEQ